MILSDTDVEWVVNDNAELGVKIGIQFFWLYKGHSLIYKDGKHDNGFPMYWRPVGKRESESVAILLHSTKLPEQYREGDGWEPLPTAEA